MVGEWATVAAAAMMWATALWLLALNARLRRLERAAEAMEAAAAEVAAPPR